LTVIWDRGIDGDVSDTHVLLVGVLGCQLCSPEPGTASWTHLTKRTITIRTHHLRRDLLWDNHSWERGWSHMSVTRGRKSHKRWMRGHWRHRHLRTASHLGMHRSRSRSRSGSEVDRIIVRRRHELHGRCRWCSLIMLRHDGSEGRCHLWWRVLKGLGKWPGGNQMLLGRRILSSH
jgi:hypothetical protein